MRTSMFMIARTRLSAGLKRHADAKFERFVKFVVSETVWLLLEIQFLRKCKSVTLRLG